MLDGGHRSQPAGHQLFFSRILNINLGFAIMFRSQGCQIPTVGTMSEESFTIRNLPYGLDFQGRNEKDFRVAPLFKSLVAGIVEAGCPSRLSDTHSTVGASQG